MLKTHRLTATSALVIAASLLLAVNLLAGLTLKGWKLDMTENRLYTLSDGTRRILAQLGEPVTLRFYFSHQQFSDNPVIATYAQRVEELLEEYAAASDGRLRLIVEDPDPYSEAQEQAARFGLQGVPVDTHGGFAYFGLVGSNAVDDIRRIPFFQPEQEDALEYTVSKMIYALAHPRKPVVGLISGLPISAGSGGDNPLFGEQSRDWFALSQIKQSFEVMPLQADSTQIPASVDVLMLVYPRDLSEGLLFAIDQYVLAGGRALVFLDSFSETDTSLPQVTSADQGYVEAVRSADLQPLLHAWGLQLVPDQVAADRRVATSVTTSSGTAIDYIVWLTLHQQYLNPEDFVTADLNTLVMASAGYLYKRPDASTRITPLIQTSDQAMSLEAGYIKYGTKPTDLLQMYSVGGSPLVLAARVRGEIESAFPTPPPTVATSQRLLRSREPANLIVVADSDLLADRFWVDFQDFYGRQVAVTRADNGAFVLNALENLSGSNDLIGLRSRGPSARPFTRVSALKEAAERQFRAKERALQLKLGETEQQINELRQQKETEGKLIISPEQRASLRELQLEQLGIRKELRAVQHDLTRSIEELGNRVKLLNLGLVPLLIVLLAGVIGSLRLRRRRRVSCAPD